jgi:uncharacterized repeat protein (TIGR03803 family)
MSSVCLRSILHVLLPMMACVLLLPQSASAYKFHVIHSICDGEICLGSSAGAGTGLLMDAVGNLYGASVAGGAFRAGSIFELSPGADNKHWTYRALYDFCPKDCTKGTVVFGRLIADVQGNLYGLTTVGGKNNLGNVFELMPNADRSKWTYKVLHDFCCSQAFGFNFGLSYAGAAAGALYDGQSGLYGASAYGGGGYTGNVFVLTPRAGRKTWSYRQLYAFCPTGTCTDGKEPWMGGVVVDPGGYLYGTTMAGGANGAGVVFKLAPGGRKQPWTETVLYNFCSLADCADGNSPTGSLLLDRAGNLYGTTLAGDTTCAIANHCGVVFKLTPGGQETVLHRFCQQGGCADGKDPGGDLLMDGKGRLVGATFDGGNEDGGTVFRLGRSFEVLHAFCAEDSCSDGDHAWAGLAMSPSGNIFGTTQLGGQNDYGAVFELAK